MSINFKDTITKTNKTITKMVDFFTKHNLSSEINVPQSHSMVEWLNSKKNLQKSLKKTKKVLKRHVNSNKQKYISERINNIQEERNSEEPSKFFRYTDPESIYSSQ